MCDRRYGYGDFPGLPIGHAMHHGILFSVYEIQYNEQYHGFREVSIRNVY